MSAPRFPISTPLRNGLYVSWLPIFLLLALNVISISEAHAQAIILKDGVRIEKGNFEIKDNQIARTVTLGNGQKALVNINTSDIESLDWPDVPELLQAQNQLSEGKLKEASETLQKAKEYFTPFKDVKGNPYQQISLAHVEALDQAGDFDALLRALPEVEKMKWGEQDTLKLRIIKLNMQRRTSSNHDELLTQAKTILASTDDSAISGRIWMTIADIHLRKEAFEDALMAALNVPVFYGSQSALVPQAELFAARCLAKMERFEDARGFYQRIVESYPDSEAGNIAKQEMLPIGGLQNKPDSVTPAKTSTPTPTPTTTSN
ncbi:tetratricopeptide repeat protein [Phragmitibacter flavus]|uniref:Tetratricopeptide repeat protein n=1 Tax=Phragmitibacter flavus TaxID=2576071 RepID=A0A5R8KBB1_9BACT|nr:tetratricopeptide repeat protein [Phragmitibacter flavus]TLD69586.1 tetratricopeptide repeat protein [Phragmitibacter flavus]